MPLMNEETFVFVDCEATGLDLKNDQIVELALVKFTFNTIMDSREDLINPGIPIPAPSINIHHITDQMVTGKPKIQEVLPAYLELIGTHTIIGHAVMFDITLMDTEAKRHGIHSTLFSLPFIDTLRLARLYGECPTNSLESLRKHFNIPSQGAHRAMNDVMVNIEVFKHLSKKFKTSEKLFKRLEKPIALKTMPLGKHRGRYFQEIPIEYLRWAVHQDFDQDLLFSIKTELKKRKQGNLFSQAGNPFQGL